MVGSPLPHSEHVEHHDEHGPPARDTPAGRPADPDRERFLGIVAALTRQDPRFVRRVSPQKRGLVIGDLMLVLGLVATVVLGALPLALGLHFGATALLAVGAAGCLVLPVGAPVIVRSVLRRTRPGMA